MTLRIDELPLGTPDVGDFLEFQDVSDTTDRLEGTSKRLDAADILGGAKFDISPRLESAAIAASNPAIVDTGTPQYRINFDDTTPQSVEFLNNLVSNLGAGAIRCTLILASKSSIAGTIRFNVSLWACNDDGASMVTNYDTPNNTGDITVAGVAGNRFSHDFELTNKSTITDGSLLNVRIERDATNDTAVDDAWLVGVRIYEA